VRAGGDVEAVLEGERFDGGALDSDSFLSVIFVRFEQGLYIIVHLL
jgi:hypothetical protein